MGIIKIFLITAFMVVGEADNKIRYLSAEQPKVTYFNPKYFSYVNFTSHRYSRYDPQYYVSIHFDSIYSFHNNLSANFFFYEFLSYNKYRRSLLEMHFKFCDMVSSDPIFGRPMNQGKLAQYSCPYPPGDYHLYNMSIPSNQIPNNFPSTKGRLECNVTSDNNDLLVSGYIDLEIKRVRLRKRKEKRV